MSLLSASRRELHVSRVRSPEYQLRARANNHFECLAIDVSGRTTRRSIAT